MPSTSEYGRARGQLVPPQIQPRQIAELAYVHGWRDKNLIIAVAVCLSESDGYVNAFNDNLVLLSTTKVDQVVANPELYYHMTVLDPVQGTVRLEDGTVEDHPPESEVISSRDVGLWEINLPASAIGTPREAGLYDPDANAQAARNLFENRGWDPWVGYTSGVALNPSWWKWSETRQAWVSPGRRLHKAIKGVANFMALEFEIVSEKNMFVDFYKIPAKPTAPPEEG